MNIFSIYLLRNPKNVCWTPQNSARFSKQIDLRGHMPRFSWKIDDFPAMSFFSEMIDLRGHMPRFTLKMNIFPSISLETP